MPRGRQPQGEQALTNAERQARYRARHQANQPHASHPLSPAQGQTLQSPALA